ICIFLPKQPRFRFEYEKGKIWMHEDLIAPYNFAILKTPNEIRADREQVLESVYPVYDNHTETKGEETERFLAEFEGKWKGSGQEDREMGLYSQTVTQILAHIYDRGVIGLTKKFQTKGEHYNFNLVTNNITEKKNTAEVYTRETALAYANSIIDSKSSITEKDWLKSLVGDYIQPNYVYNERLTDKLIAEAINNISTTRGMVQRGELIVANGSMVNNEVFQKVESLRMAYEEEAKIGGDRNVVVIGQFLVVGLVVTLLMVFLYLFRIDVFSNNRLLSLILLVVTGMLIVLSWSLKLKLSSLY